jgi:ribosome-binding protein aMBF1 (putative translation factor)
MPALTKTHLTNKERKAKPSSTVRKKSIPWRVSAKKEITKYTEVGAMVRAGRYKAGLTQKQLADMLEILPHHVSEMEHGKRPVSKKMAHKLGKIFKLDYRIFL